MPVSRSRTKKDEGRKKTRFVKGSVPPKQSKTRAAKSTPGNAPKKTAARKAKPSPKPSRTSVSLTPGWKELSKKTRKKETPFSVTGTMLGALSTLRFSLSVLAVAGVVTLYVGHVHATEDLLADVQQTRRDNLALHLRYNRVKGAYDQSTGPSVIYDRAHTLGLEERIAGGPIIRIEP